MLTHFLTYLLHLLQRCCLDIAVCSLHLHNTEVNIISFNI